MSFRWYRCHGCYREFPLTHPRGDHVRTSSGCVCFYPDVHVHSDADGELPVDQALRDVRETVRLITRPTLSAMDRANADNPLNAKLYKELFPERKAADETTTTPPNSYPMTSRIEKLK